MILNESQCQLVQKNKWSGNYYIRSVREGFKLGISGWGFLTFESNLVHLSGQPPLGGTVGAAVVLTGEEFPRLQMNWCSWPQLEVLHKPVSTVEMQ